MAAACCSDNLRVAPVETGAKAKAATAYQGTWAIPL